MTGSFQKSDFKASGGKKKKGDVQCGHAEYIYVYNTAVMILPTTRVSRRRYHFPCSNDDPERYPRNAVCATGAYTLSPRSPRPDDTHARCRQWDSRHQVDVRILCTTGDKRRPHDLRRCRGRFAWKRFPKHPGPVERGTGRRLEGNYRSCP